MGPREDEWEASQDEDGEDEENRPPKEQDLKFEVARAAAADAAAQNVVDDHPTIEAVPTEIPTGRRPEAMRLGTIVSNT